MKSARRRGRDGLKTDEDGNPPAPTQSQLVRADLALDLQARIDGEVRFDEVSRALYSTDASNHQIRPLGVAIPRHVGDLTTIVKLAAERNVPVLPRGAGTSLAGQAVGEAIIVDCSKYLNQILNLDASNRTALVEPGVVCAQLNTAAREFGLMYGPDPASADRATFGGMIGNNATGAHSIRYGMTADNVIGMEVTLSDGATADFGRMGSRQWASKLSTGGLEGVIYRAAQRARHEYADEVRRNWPKTWRRASGYSLNYVTGHFEYRPPAWFAKDIGYPPDYSETNLAHLLVGSEGTLAVLRKAWVRLVPIPPTSVLVALPFASVVQATRETPDLLRSEPSAIELLPRALLERAQTIPAYSRRMSFIDEIPEALLVIEYAGDSQRELLASAKEAAGKQGRVLVESKMKADLWEVRKAGLGLLMSVPGDTKPITFIEDVAVPVDQLAYYVDQVEGILERNGTTAEWYAHASAGCLHLRPMVNLKTSSGVRQMRAIAEEVARLVFKLNGSLSGEHGDGLTHTEFNERLFGPVLMQAFHEIKTSFDPQGILNPGKVVPSTSASAASLDGPLRYGPNYSVAAPNTIFAFRREGSLAGAVEACTGVGVCRKHEGLMCPSYQATRDEKDLTRGRANVLRMALSGGLQLDPLGDERILEVLDLCLECKGCKAECPTAVDIAKVKSEFLSHYHEKHGLPLRGLVFAEIHRLSRLLQPLSGLTNWFVDTRVVRSLQRPILGIASGRSMPKFAREPFRPPARSSPSTRSESLVLFVDTYTRYMQPEVGVAAAKVLSASGADVFIVEQQVCCGRPMISKGLLGQAQRLLRTNLALLSPHAKQGRPIVVLEPSCASVFQDDALDLSPDEPRAKAVANATVLLEEYLVGGSGSRPIDTIPFAVDGEGEVVVHSHCHVKSLRGVGATTEALRAAGYAATELASGCCGMAGSFGYESEHYDISLQIGELALLPAARQAAHRGVPIAAHGFSCRTQIQDGSEARVLHPAELLAQKLATCKDGARRPDTG
jgi:FAD/FMN-containing dehydrogenase/Fe-S oxidoreductase